MITKMVICDWCAREFIPEEEIMTIVFNKYVESELDMPDKPYTIYRPTVHFHTKCYKEMKTNT